MAHGETIEEGRDLHRLGIRCNVALGLYRASAFGLRDNLDLPYGPASLSLVTDGDRSDTGPGSRRNRQGEK